MAQDRSQFSIIEALVILSSVTGEEQGVDVLRNIRQLTLFENLYNPYIDAEIVLLDDFDLRKNLNIQGTERIKLVIGDTSNPEQPLITKYFFFSKITDSKKAGERAEILVIQLIEEHVYINSIKEFSKSYTDTLENIAESILSTEFGKTVKRRYFDGSVQGVRKLIVPFLTPIEAIRWVMRRATTKIGSPIFLRGDLYSNNLIMSDLDSLLRRKIVNEDIPLIHNTAMASISDLQDKKRTYYEVLSFRDQNNYDALGMYEDGAIGSYYANIDAASGQVVGSHISIRDVVDDFFTNEVLSSDIVQSLFDPALVIDDKLSDQYNSVHVFQVTANNTYNQYKSYHDETILLDADNNIIESRLKIRNKIIRVALAKNVVDIGMAGSLYFEGKVTVGNKIRVIFVSPNVAVDKEDIATQIDTKKSGDYLITAIRHLLIDQRHNSVLSLVKFGDLPKDYRL